MTWEIVAGLITLVGALITMGGVLAKLVATLTRLDTTMKMLQESLTAVKNDNKESHQHIYNKLDEHEDRIHTLEVRGAH